VIHAAYRVGVKKLIFLASSIVYPCECDQPMAEAQLLSGPLEPTNEPYSVAKIVGIKLCEFYYRSCGANFFTPIPCNLYGPYDHFGREDSHVLAALIHRFHTAKAEKVPSVTLWGSGTVRREFLYSGTTIISYLVMLVSRNYFLLYFFKHKNLLQLILRIVPLAGYVFIIYLVEIFVGNIIIGYAVKITSFGLFVLLIWFSFGEFRNMFKSLLSGIHH
jgi:nucleoside-diphosphate-sugar epimerase